MKQQLDLPLCDILKASRPISPNGSFLYLNIVLIDPFLVGDISSQSLRPIIFLLAGDESFMISIFLPLKQEMEAALFYLMAPLRFITRSAKDCSQRELTL